MKKQYFLLSFFWVFILTVYSQNNPLTSGSNNVRVEQIQLNNNTDIDLIIEKKVEVEVLQSVPGVNKGFKFIPILHFLPRHTPGIINIDAEEIRAERNALENTGGDIILNKKVERTYKGFFLVFWIEKIEITGLAAKIIK